jgi:ubiquinone/menaquinone biosynthesis C-methylase UbiE
VEFVTTGSYDAIAEWYDAFLRENPIYEEIVLPTLLDLVGDVDGCDVCDIACGQGFVSRALAQRGARVTGVDIAPRLLDLARRYEEKDRSPIRYVEDDAQTLHSLPGGTFDLATCGMALMNIPDISAAFQAARRILEPDGRYVFIITHPCFQTPHARWVDGDDGRQVRQVSDYFDEGYWTASRLDDVRSRQGEHHRTLGTYLNGLADAGFALERIVEPRASGRSAERYPGRAHVPAFLAARCRVLAAVQLSFHRRPADSKGEAL